MAIDPTSLSQRVSTSFSKLTAVAADLNAVSDELGKTVTQIDDRLRKLNLGLTVWIPISTWSGGRYNDTAYGSQELGYAKLSSKWGISLRTVEADHNDPDEEEIECWLFSDAPRSLRLSAIEKIPELLEKLSTEAAKAADQVKARMADVRAVALALNPPKPSISRLVPEGTTPTASLISAKTKEAVWVAMGKEASRTKETK